MAHCMARGPLRAVYTPMRIRHTRPDLLLSGALGRIRTCDARFRKGPEGV